MARLVRRNEMTPKKAKNRDKAFWSLVSVGSACSCWRWNGGQSRKGYGRFWDGKKTVQANRYAWKTKHGKEMSPEKDACHTCDHPWCVNPDHIWGGTRSENLKDSIKKGRWHRLDMHLHGRRVLKEEDIPNIVQLCDSGVSQKFVANRFGVTRQRIGQVVRVALKAENAELVTKCKRLERSINTTHTCKDHYCQACEFESDRAKAELEGM